MKSSTITAYLARAHNLDKLAEILLDEIKTYEVQDGDKQPLLDMLAEMKQNRQEAFQLREAVLSHFDIT